MRRTLAVLALLLSACSAAEPSRRTIEIEMRETRFEPNLLRGRPGERVRFVLRNIDPIDHEFVIGDKAFQKEHREQRGSTGGMHHGAEPGVAEVAKGETVTMDYTFPAAPGPLEIACYVESHYEAGMRGEVSVEV